MRLLNIDFHRLPSFLLLLLAVYPHQSLTSNTSPSLRQKSSFLIDSSPSDHHVQEILEHQPAQHVVCTKPTGPIETTLCDYESVESVNTALYASLNELVKAPFFKYFRTDLYKECPFWYENGFCADRGCVVTTVDESEIPPAWRAEALSKVEPPTEAQRSDLPGCYYREADFCFIDDITADGEYFDLTQNPERFTGYSGPPAHRVWASIYEENCFGISEQSLNRPISESNLLGLGSIRGETHVCEEKRVYYRIISGLHASISTHICRDYLNQSTGDWSANIQCFINRIASHPERLQHIYFNTVLLLRAVARLSPYLSAYDYCSTPEGVHEHDGGNIKTKQTLESVMAVARQVGRFDESVLFQGENANILKEEFKKHFRNVSQIMDCVGCNKCRLWGKVQVSGLGTALKILFELDEKELDPNSNPNLLQRSEVVALMNTLHRFTESLVFVDEFRQLWAHQGDSEKKSLLQSLGLEKTTGTHRPKTKPSPLASSHERANDIESLTERLRRLLHACGRSTADCLQLCARMVGTILNALSSIIGMRGKYQSPKADL